jgi:hypothetical protein
MGVLNASQLENKYGGMAYVIEVISDDNSSYSFLTQLVSLAALLRLLSHVPALPSSGQS